MPTIGAPLRKWTPLLLLCSVPTLALVQSANETAAHVDPSAANGHAASSTDAKYLSANSSPHKPSSLLYSDTACPFRTINYITHTLPQQCLKTSWSAPGQLAEGTGADGEGASGPPEATISTGAGSEGLGEGHRPGPSSVGSFQPKETASPHGTTNTQPESELETDSPLDNANFLSFEEWKMKNLARAGQSPENVGQGRAASSGARAQRRPVNINALDSLGEESEIEIDFSGFGKRDEESGGSHMAQPGASDVAQTTTPTDDDDKVAPSSWALSKDAGKTCKERFNYASFDCAATVHKTNPKAKSSSSILIENKDSYMLNECSASNKFFIVELCDDILVDTIVLANYEFFSSMFRHFRVSVSDRYPVKMDRWRTLGTFEARNSREIQPFLVTEPQIWARYLRIEFLTHYGNEFYCPLSLLRVHGTTMMEQFRREEEQARGDDDFVPIEAVDGDPVKTAEPISGEDESVPTQPLPSQPDKVPVPVSEAPAATDETLQSEEPMVNPSHRSASVDQQSDVSAVSEEPTTSSRSTAVSQKADSMSESTLSSSSTSSSLSLSANETRVTETAGTDGRSVFSSSGTKSADTISAKSPPTEESTVKVHSTTQSSKTARSVANETASAPSGSSMAKAAANSTANGSPVHSQPRSSQTQPGPAVPTTQESFFKSIHKRLQQLEVNSTLSLQYIEEQSRILRDAFMKVEKRQLTKTEKFLDHLNSTVMQELKSYRSMYDQLWQSTILELEGMKERQKAEIGEIGARLSLVADELVWQKRMAVVQSTLLLLCLGLVLFVRSGTLGSQPDVPIVQQLGHRYSSFFDSPPRSPPNTGSLRRRSTFRNMWRNHSSAGLSERSGHYSDGMNGMSDVETDGRRSPAQVTFAPATPMTPSAASDMGRETGISPRQVGGVMANVGVDQASGLLTPTEASGDDQAKRIQVLETQSGPATPRGSRDSRPSWEEVDRAVDLLKAEEQGQAQELELNLQRERRLKRSPLRRAESYDGAEDSPGNDSGDGLFTAD